MRSTHSGLSFLEARFDLASYSIIRFFLFIIRFDCLFVLVLIWTSKTPTDEDIKATRAFIDIVKSIEIQSLLYDGKTQKIKVWQRVAFLLGKSGFQVGESIKEGGVRCFQKWRNLERTYCTYVTNMKNIGVENRKPPPHFEMMNEIMEVKQKPMPEKYDFSKCSSEDDLPLNFTLPPIDTVISNERRSSPTSSRSDTPDNKGCPIESTASVRYPDRPSTSYNDTDRLDVDRYAGSKRKCRRVGSDRDEVLSMLLEMTRRDEERAERIESLLREMIDERRAFHRELKDLICRASYKKRKFNLDSD